MYPSKPSELAGAAPVTGIPVGGPAAASQWSSGLFDCFDDCGLCKQSIIINRICMHAPSRLAARHGTGRQAHSS